MGWAMPRRPRASEVTSAVKSSKLAPVASSTLAMLSVVGQRGRPSPVMRFDLLKDVGSSPARLARRRREAIAARKRVYCRPNACMGEPFHGQRPEFIPNEFSRQVPIAATTKAPVLPTWEPEPRQGDGEVQKSIAMRAQERQQLPL